MAQAQVKLEESEKQQVIKDLKECESIKEDIERAKRAKIAGVEMLEERYQSCLESLQLKYQEYAKRGK